jgi:hypothetical protein
LILVGHQQRLIIENLTSRRPHADRDQQPFLFLWSAAQCDPVQMVTSTQVMDHNTKRVSNACVVA